MLERTMEKVVGAFEQRMGLRRRMLAATGVTVPESGLSLLQEVEERAMIVRCFECRSESACVGWLEGATGRTDPPAFCPNATAIRRMRALTDLEADCRANP